MEPVYNVVEDKALDAAYYRNNAIHFLFTGAIADLALAKLYLDGAVTTRCRNWKRKCCSYANCSSGSSSSRKRMSSWRVSTATWISATATGASWSAGQGWITPAVSELTPLLGHGALEPYLEAYRIVAEQLLRKWHCGSSTRKRSSSDCLNIGRQLHLQRQVVSRESIAKAMFDTGLKVAKSRGLLDISVSAG